MKKKALKKEFRTEVRKSLNRFLSIFFIVAMGVAFFSGIQASAPDMRATGDYYFDSTNLMDIKVLGTLGLTEEDLEAVRQAEGVSEAEGVYMEDVYCGEAGEVQQVLHTESIPETMNLLTAEEGTVPQKSGECFLDQSYAASHGYQVGDTLKLTVSGDETQLKRTEYRIAGIGYSSTYIAFERGSTTLGNGSVSGFVYLLPEDYDAEVYSTIYVRVAQAEDEMAYTDGYDALVAEVQDRIEAMEDLRCEARYAEVMGEANDGIADAQKELDEGKEELADAKKEFLEGKAEAESELAQAESELTEGESELQKGKEALEDSKTELEKGEEELQSGESELEENEQQLRDADQALLEAQSQLQEGETSYQQGLLEYQRQSEAAETQFAQAEEQIRTGEQQLEAGRREYEAQSEQLKEAEQELAASEAQLTEAQRKYEEGAAEFAKSKQEYESGAQQFAQAKQEYETAAAQLAAGKQEYEAGAAALAQAKASLDQQEQELKNGRSQYEAGKKQLNDAKKAYEKAWKEYEQQCSAYETAEKELQALQQTYDREAAVLKNLQESAAQKEKTAKEKQGICEAKQTLLDTWNQTLQSAQQEQSSWESKAAELTTAMETTQQNLDAANETLTEAKERYETLSQDPNAAAEDLQSAEAAVTTAQSLVDTHQTTLAQQEQEKAAALAAAEDARLRAEEAQANISTVQQELTLAQQEAQTAQQEAEAARQEADLQKTKTEQYEEKLKQDTEALASQKAQLEQQKQTLDAQKQTLTKTERELNQQKQALDAAQAAITAGREELAQKEAELAAVKTQLDATEAQLTAAKAELDAKEKELAEAKAQLDAAEQTLAATKTQLDTGWAQLAAGKAQVQEGKRQLRAAKSQLDASQKQLDEAKAQLAAGRAQLESAKNQLNQARNELDLGWAELNASKAQLQDGWRQLAEGKAQLEEARNKLADGRRQIEEGEKELAENEQKLKDSWLEYEKGKKEAEEKIADGEKEIADAEKELKEAEEKIADARDELSQVKYPSWYVYDRSALPDNLGFGENAERLTNIARVFPLLFFLVAALISLTTMTRMVEEERTQIGTMKALGYSKLDIAGKYLKYAFYATLGGSIVGVLIGEKIFPWIIVNAYGIMYQYMPKIMIPYDWKFGLLATGAALICTMAATCSACIRELQTVPAQLMRPPAPKEGKRVLLEYLPFIWKPLSFTWKSTIRNLMRYKKRFLMTVIGIGGCMGLLLVGFGLRDSIMDVAILQFEQLQLYDGMVILDSDASKAERQEVLKEVETAEEVEAEKLFYMQQIQARGDETAKKEWSMYLYVPESTEDLDEFFCFRKRTQQETTYALTDEGAIVTEKIAREFGVKAGDMLVLHTDEETVEIPVAAVCENYLSHYIYLTPALYEQIYGEKPEYNSVFIKTENGISGAETVGEQLLKKDAVLNVTYTSSLKSQLDSMLGALDIVIVVLIISAGMLAFVVLYNLNNININERRRELATLKVLGFFDGEVAAYVYRENVLLTVLGAAAGILIGKFLHAFIITTVEVDACMFGRNIKIMSYVYGTLFTFAFSVIVNLVMYFKLKKIDMVESLKSVE